MTNAVRIAFLYGVFAGLATVANLGMQMAVIALYRGSHSIPLSILVGTAAGLPIKYMLEKRYIFDFRARDFVHDGRMFMTYTQMGVLTTLLFWGIEYAFHEAFRTDLMRYVGGALGLTAGYYLKYRLDKRYVFVDSR